MKLFHQAREFPVNPKGVCLAIGVFDGVHLGHQQVIRQALSDAANEEAASVMITFDRHPASVIAPERAPKLIYPLQKKLEVISSFEPDGTLVIHFDENFSKQSAEDFIHSLARDFKKIQSICVGSSFTFGHKRGGNVDLLRTLGTKLGFRVHGLAAVALDGEVVSSTRIRETLRKGEMDEATQMLGRPYSLSGTVVEGDKIGRTMGFPTANVDVAALVIPPPGVYAVHVRHKQQSLRGAVNIGFRPTVNQQAPKLQVEVHILDFSGNLYGETIELVFAQKLRDEKKFANVDELRAQIERDIHQARRLFD
jgi:riboflavin kinase/FMN adenylyltransferase